MEKIESISEKVVMFNTHENVVEERGSLIEAGRKWWRCDKDRVMRADYAFVVIAGVVRGVYEITGAHLEKDDGTANPPFEGERWVFDFAPAPAEIAQKYVGKELPDEFIPFGQNPVRYNYE